MCNVQDVVARLYPVLKTMKTSINDVVMIHNRHIIFICQNTKLSVLELEEDTFISICCLFSDIENALNEKAKGYCGVLAYNYDAGVYYNTLSTYNQYVTSCNECIASVPDFIADNPDVLNVKSDDNYILYKVNDMVFTYVSGILKVNKGDTVALDIYKGIYRDTYIMRFDVYKKKLKNTISIYMNNFKIN